MNHAQIAAAQGQSAQVTQNKGGFLSGGDQGYPRGSKTPDEFRGFLTPVKPPNPRDFESHPPNFSLKF